MYASYTGKKLPFQSVDYLLGFKPINKYTMIIVL